MMPSAWSASRSRWPSKSSKTSRWPTPSLRLFFGGLLLLLGVLAAIPSLVVLLVPWHWQAAVAWIALGMLLGLGLVLYGKNALSRRAADQDTGKFEGEQRMGSSADEIDRQINETRDHIDQNLGVLERRAASNAMRYGRIAAVVLGVVTVAGAGVLIYRRMNRPSRREQLKSMLVEALTDLPNYLRDLPDEVTSRLKKPLPSVKVVVNGDEAGREPGTLESVVRKIVPAVVGTASTALIERFTRPSAEPERSAVPAFD